MGKPKRSGCGFSARELKAKTNQPIKREDINNLSKQALNLARQGRLEEAELVYRRLIDADPSSDVFHGNLGAILKMQGKLEEASRHTNKALELNPGNPDAHNNAGIIHKDLGRIEASISAHERAIELKPGFPEAYLNLGNSLQEAGNLASAIAAFGKAIALKPGYLEASWNLSQAMLLMGNYPNGWELYDCRAIKANEPIHPIAIPSCPAWSRDLKSCRYKLLVVSEQGLGDTLQFMRYVIALRKHGFQVSLCAQPKLHSLIQNSEIDPSPLTPDQAREVTDGQWMPLLSVPRCLEVSPENPIITKPYIKTTDELVGKWKGILSAEQRPIIGINWQGNPSHEKRNCIGRSLPLETFAAIATKTNATLLSLQKGFGSEQLETCSFRDRFVRSQNQVNDTWDFLETAAIIANCELVITSDTSVAHLAGGMGKTTWLLLKKVPEWRWGLEGDTTFWYPSMRLFRQRERGNWNEVMERVAEAFQEHFGNGSVPTQPAAASQPAIKPEAIQDILAPISLGELIDKITILQIKTQHLQGTALENVKKELEALEITLSNLQPDIDHKLIQRLKEINQDLWKIEDKIRDQERQQSFGATFIELARSVYQQNDRRAAIKREINTTCGSTFVEEKSYQQY
jgi:Tfp pilus assembly protein PilF